MSYVVRAGEAKAADLMQGYDALEVEATVIHDDAGWWLAAPDGNTRCDTSPQASPMPTAKATQ